MNCEELALDNSWELTRKNACHIAVQNGEMGELRDAQLAINVRVDQILVTQGVLVSVWIFIGIALGKKVINFGGKKAAQGVAEEVNASLKTVKAGFDERYKPIINQVVKNFGPKDSEEIYRYKTISTEELI